MAPLFSIVITLYNTGDLIQNPIKSLDALNNKNGEFEFIFINDGSSSDDSSLKIVSDFAKSHPATKLLSFANEGVGEARNRGVKEAKGKWVIFLDGDDFLQPGLFGTFKRVQLQANADVYVSKYRSVSSGNVFQVSSSNYNYSVVPQEKALMDFLIRRHIFLIPGTIFKRQFLIDHQIWHEKIKWSEDQNFAWKVLSEAKVIVSMSYIGYNYRQNVSGSMMATTGINRFYESLEKMRLLSASMKIKKVERFLVPRWLLGCYRVLAKRNEKDMYKAFLEGTNSKFVFKELMHFPSFSVRIIGIIGLASPNLLFHFLRIK